MENNEHDRQIDNRTRGMRRQRPQATEEEIAKRKDLLKEKVQ